MAIGAIIPLACCYCPFVTAISLGMYCLPTLPLMAFAGASVFAEKSRPTAGRQTRPEGFRHHHKTGTFGATKNADALDGPIRKLYGFADFPILGGMGSQKGRGRIQA